MASKDSDLEIAAVALLRGINVGGKNLLPMKDLAALFTAAGCTAVQTYIQSGNVIFRAKPRLLEGLSKQITAAIAESFGHRVPVILRTAAQMRDTLRHNPFLAKGADEANLHVYFLADSPTPAAIAALDPDRSPPDAFAVYDRDVYLHLPGGMARTKLTNLYFDKKLATIATARNWRTTLKLSELLRQL